MSGKSSLNQFLYLAIVVSCLSVVEAGYRRCGIWDCYGTGVYCCAGSCCYYVYSYWWFWSIWAAGIAIIIGVVVGCCRRRRRLANAGIIVRQAQPVAVYGSSTYNYSSTGNNTPAYTGPAQSNYNPYANQSNPASAPAYQEKPPSYAP